MPIVGGDGGELVGVALPRVHGVQAQVLLLGRVLGEEEAKLVEGRRVGQRPAKARLLRSSCLSGRSVGWKATLDETPRLVRAKASDADPAKARAEKTYDKRRA